MKYIKFFIIACCLIAGGAEIVRGQSGNFSTSEKFVMKNGEGNTITLAAPSTGVTNYTLTFPPTVGGAGLTLYTNNATGVLSWISVPTGTGTVTGTNTGDVTLAGTANYLSLAGQVITRNAIDLAFANNITGILPSGNGGTGVNNAGRTITIASNLNIPVNAAGALVNNGSGTLSWTSVPTGSGTVTGTNTGDVTLAGTANYLSLAGQVITLNAIDLANANNIAGLLSSTNGGTGVNNAGRTITIASNLNIPVNASGALINNGSGTLSWTSVPTGTGTVTGTNTGDQTITLTGDVTGSGTGSFATTIAANAVTYAKMQAVSTTSKLLGSSSTTTPVQEITIGSGLSLSGTTLSAIGGTGTVTSVGLTVPGVIFTSPVSGSPVTTSGTLALALNTQAVNTVFAGPSSGGVATPTFRSLVAADLPAGTGTVTSVGLTVPGVIFTTPVSGSPVTTSGTLALALNAQAANTVFAGPTTGANATPTFRALATADIPDLSASYIKNQITPVQTSSNFNISGQGQATSFSGTDAAAGVALTVRGGNGSSGAGAALTLSGGTSTGTSAGAGVSISATNASTTGSGGAISMTAGNGVGTNQNGGNITLSAGDATGTGTAGVVKVAGGDELRLMNSANTFYSGLKSANSANVSYTLPLTGPATNQVLTATAVAGSAVTFGWSTPISTGSGGSGGIGSSYIARSPIDVKTTSGVGSNIAVTATGLAFPVGAGETWQFVINVSCQGDDKGVNVGMSYPAGGKMEATAEGFVDLGANGHTAYYRFTNPSTAGVTTSGTVLTLVGGSAGGALMATGVGIDGGMRIAGFLDNSSGAAGTAQVVFANAGVANSNQITFYKNSFLTAWKYATFFDQSFTTSQSYVVPAGITTIYVGGVGGAGGGGGGAGEYNTAVAIAVTPGETLTITIGAGGTAGAGGIVAGNVAPTAGGAGGLSKIERGATVLLSANGGSGGGGGTNAPNGGNGAAGALGAGGVVAGSTPAGGVAGNNGTAGTAGSNSLVLDVPGGAGGNGPTGSNANTGGTGGVGAHSAAIAGTTNGDAGVVGTVGYIEITY